MTPPGSRTKRIVFSRKQLISAHAIKCDKAGNFISFDTSKYEPIYAFGHWDPTQVADFVQIYMEESKEPLEMTPEHLVFLQSQPQTPVRADALVVGDVLLGNNKVVGSAQRRTKHGLMQHGSILLASSAVATELPGIVNLSDKQIKAEDFIKSWQKHLESSLSFSFREQAFTSEESGQIKGLIANKFGNSVWQSRR